MKHPIHKPGERTLEDFIADLGRKNKTLADWAREHDFSLPEVYQLAAGRTLGRRGKAREILIAMGVTPPPMYGHIPTGVKRPLDRNRASAKAAQP